MPDARNALLVMSHEESVAMLTSGRPVCPNCSLPLELRRAKIGRRKDKRFWGCPNFFQTRCQFTIDISDDGTWGGIMSGVTRLSSTTQLKPLHVTYVYVTTGEEPVVVDMTRGMVQLLVEDKDVSILSVKDRTNNMKDITLEFVSEGFVPAIF